MDESFRTVLGALVAGVPLGQEESTAQRPRPFITIARQAGARGRSLMGKLVQRLRELDPAQPPWTGFDRELVEKVAAEHQLYQPLVESLGRENRSYLEELLASLTVHHPMPTEFAVYRRVAQTIRALAQAGRVIIVGRGGVFITRNMPQGLHILLVAPLEDRIEATRQRLGLSRQDAAEWVKRLDENRQAFYRRYWPQHSTGPESFSVTYNTASLSVDAIVESILPLIPGLHLTVGAAAPQQVG